MNVAFRRFFAVFSLVALVSVVAAAPSNAATPTGVGSAGGTTTIAALDAGDLLKLALIGEQSAASLDPAVGTPSATETLSPLTLSSVTLPGVDARPASTTTTSTGDADVENIALLDLASLSGGTLTGRINPATLSSLVDATGAASALTSTLANLGVLGGIAKVDSASVNLGGLAAPTLSTANRQLSADGITVLDLRALLNLLGLDLNTLPLGTLTGLIGQLNLLGALNTATGSAFGTAGQLLTAVTNAEGAAGPALASISGAQAAVDAAAGALSAAQGALGTANANFAACGLVNLPPLCDPLQALVAIAQGNVLSAQGVLVAAQAALATLQATLAGVLGTLNNLLNGIGDVLGTAKLLQVEGIQVGATATAKDIVANSSALVTGVIGDIKVGGLDLGGIDVTAALDQVTALASQATNQLNSILATISPSLGNLVKVELFKKATDVTQNGDYVKAVAGITGLIATVTPPDLCALLGDVLGQLPVGGNTLPGVSLPALPIPSLLTTLGSVIDCSTVPAAGARQTAILAHPALLNPVTLTAAQASSVAEFTPVVAPTTTTTTPTGSPLPRTGMNETLLLLIGGMMAAVALGLRRASAPVKVRANRTTR